MGLRGTTGGSSGPQSPHPPGHELEGGLQSRGVRGHQDGVKVAGDEVARDVLQVGEHGCQPLAHLHTTSDTR